MKFLVEISNETARQYSHDRDISQHIREAIYAKIRKYVSCRIEVVKITKINDGT